MNHPAETPGPVPHRAGGLGWLPRQGQCRRRGLRPELRRFVSFSGEGDQPPVLLAESLETLGAVSMLLIDACDAPDVAAKLESHARRGSLIAGLDYGPGNDQVTWGRDSVTALGAVIRELCYPDTKDLSPPAAARAVNSVNAQIDARNDAERKRGVPKKYASRPLLSMHQC